MNVRSLNLNLVPILEALLSERSVTRAARRLGMTQPAVSNALAQLRVIFDDPILVRSGPRMTPTQRALELETPLAEWLAELERLLGPGEFDPAKESRTFTLATTDYVGFVLLPLLLAELARRAPGIRLRIQAWPHHRVTPSLERGEVDLMIGFYEQLPASHREETLFEDRFVCIVRKDHPRVGRRLTLGQYVKLEHILVSADPHGPGVVDHALAARGSSRSVALRLSHFLLGPAVVAAPD
jgi:DNA-binding transcriptional LysR family regulator